MKYFISSVRYNWTNPVEIGFIEDKEEGVYINPNDNSKWKKMRMLDLGWGIESGLYRLPTLALNELLDIVFEYKKKNNKVLSDDDNNFYGSLSYLIQHFPYELLEEFNRRINLKLIDKNSSTELIMFLNKEYQCSENLIDKLSDKRQKELIIKWKKIKEKL